MTTQEIRDRILAKFPTSNFEILHTDGCTSHPITLKCLDCGEEKTYTTITSGVLGPKKTTFCTNCKRQAPTPLQKAAIEVIEARDDIEFVKWIGRGTKGKVVFKCNKCEKETDRLLHKFVTQERQACAWCSPSAKRKDQDLVAKAFLEKGFEMLEPYENAHTKISFRHIPCGFIFKTIPTNLTQRYNCPRCDDTHESAGARMIKEFFDKEGIFYEKEKTFPDWFERHYRYDFYVPSLHLLIEFMGEQHYKDVPFFSRERSFEDLQTADKEKEDKAREQGYNFLVIKYNEVKDIDSILRSTTTSLSDVGSSELK